MLNAIINWSLHHRMLVLALTLLTAMLGGYALVHLPVDAFPEDAAEGGGHAGMQGGVRPGDQVGDGLPIRRYSIRGATNRLVAPLPVTAFSC